MHIHVQELKALSFSKRKAAKVLAVSRDTVRKYWDMTDEEYMTMAEQIKKKTIPYCMNRIATLSPLVHTTKRKRFGLR